MTNMMLTLLDINDKFFASSISLDAIMKLMEGRWGGKVVDEYGRTLFDIAADREAGVKMNVKLARAERELAWNRYCEKEA